MMDSILPVIGAVIVAPYIGISILLFTMMYQDEYIDRDRTRIKRKTIITIAVCWGILLLANYIPTPTNE